MPTAAQIARDAREFIYPERLKEILIDVAELAVVSIQTKTGTAYTLLQADSGSVLNFTSGSAVTVTVPPGLTVPYVVGISQGGAGQVTLSAGSGVTLQEPDAQLATGAQYVVLSVVAFAADVYRIIGRTA